jgi:hypothetical protein
MYGGGPGGGVDRGRGPKQTGSQEGRDRRRETEGQIQRKTQNRLNTEGERERGREGSRGNETEKRPV